MEQELLQNEAGNLLQSGKIVITKWSRCYTKWGKHYYIVGQLSGITKGSKLQTGAIAITKQGIEQLNYKVRQRLPSRPVHAKIKHVHKKCVFLSTPLTKGTVLTMQQ